MVAAQQYIFSHGYGPLLDWIRRTVDAAHAPPYASSLCAGSTNGQAAGAGGACDVAVTAGAVHALSLAVSLLCDPGDWLVRGGGARVRYVGVRHCLTLASGCALWCLLPWVGLAFCTS